MIIAWGMLMVSVGIIFLMGIETHNEWKDEEDYSMVMFFGKLDTFCILLFIIVLCSAQYIYGVKDNENNKKGDEAMSNKNINFIIETLTDAIDWSTYAPECFQKKHNLKKDQENVNGAILILKNELKENKCTTE